MSRSGLKIDTSFVLTDRPAVLCKHCMAGDLGLGVGLKLRLGLGLAIQGLPGG